MPGPSPVYLRILGLKLNGNLINHRKPPDLKPVTSENEVRTSTAQWLRGGGEFGTGWHEVGRLADKRLSHDDFATVAADLLHRDVTRPGRIAAEGGSNGGLLIANVLTRYPERFGALFCTIPLIDLRPYSWLLAGAGWIAEYGDPDKPPGRWLMRSGRTWICATLLRSRHSRDNPPRRLPVQTGCRSCLRTGPRRGACCMSWPT